MLCSCSVGGASWGKFEGQGHPAGGEAEGYGGQTFQDEEPGSAKVRGRRKHVMLGFLGHGVTKEVWALL